MGRNPMRPRVMTGARTLLVVSGLALFLLAPQHAHAQLVASGASPRTSGVEFELANGLRVVVAPAGDAPVASLTLSVLGGSLYDPVRRAGTAALFARVLGALDPSVTADAGPDLLTVEVALPSGDADESAVRLAEVSLRPTIPDTVVEQQRTRMLAALERGWSEPAGLGARTFARLVYGDHPYGRHPDPESLRSITPDDLVAFHDARVRPAQGTLVIRGAIDSTTAYALADRYFGAWSGRGANPPLARPAPQRFVAEVVVVHQPEAARASVVIGNTTWMPTDARTTALSVAVRALEERLTSASVPGIPRLTWRRGVGTFAITASTTTDQTVSTVGALLGAMRGLAIDTIPAADVVRHLEAIGGSVTAVTPQHVQAAARAGMRTEGALIVVVGDAVALSDALATIAPVTVIDAEGSRVTLTRGMVGASSVRVDPARLIAARDSFAVLVQGQPFGFQTTALERTSDGWRFSEDLQIGPIVAQRTVVSLGEGLRLRTMEQGGRFQGSEFRFSVVVTAEGASGEGITPSPGGTQPVRYARVPLPDGAVESNVLLGLLPFLPWDDGARFTIDVFSPARGVMEQRTFRVLSREVVTIPAGAFAAYRVTQEGGESAETYWIESSSPHRVLKHAPAAAPLEFVRVK